MAVLSTEKAIKHSLNYKKLSVPPLNVQSGNVILTAQLNSLISTI
jgi:hypothetical protein